MEKIKSMKKYIATLILVIIGLAITVDLAYIYYQANFNQFAAPSFCHVSELIDCDGVARTTHSQFLGVPLAYWGIFLYSFILMLLNVDFLKKIPGLKFLEVFKNKFHYIASLGIISFTISMLLMVVSLFVIKKICIMCFVTYIINLFIAIIAVWGIEGGFVETIKQSWNDFVEALQPKSYRIAFVTVMVIAGIFFGWTYSSAKFTPALKWQREYGEFAQTAVNKYAVKGNILGSKKEDAIVLHVYSDYMCPICFTANNMIHKVAGEFKNLRVEHHALPLDKECNKYLPTEFHKGSCRLAKYAEAAQMQGKFWEVNTLFFEKRPFTEQETLEVLKNSGFGLDMNKLQKDANSNEVKNIINKDIDYAFSKGMIGTPALKIGDDFEMGIKGYHDLKKWIIEHGGQPKKLF